jgi:lysophospholipase L1-like esterase
MPQVVYFALGDSLSAGKGDPDDEGRLVGWARRMCSMLSDATGSTYAFTNLAVNRATISDVVTGQLPAVVAGEPPDLITVTIGINDIRGAFDPDLFETQVGELLDALVQTGATVVTMTIPDIVHLLPLPAELKDAARQIIELANDAIRRSADARGVLYLDAYVAREVADPGFWDPDGMHPNSNGHELIARAATDQLLAAGPRRGVPEPVAADLPPAAADLPAPATSAAPA